MDLVELSLAPEVFTNTSIVLQVLESTRVVMLWIEYLARIGDMRGFHNEGKEKISGEKRLFLYSV
jgi:hypothetical protein